MRYQISVVSTHNTFNARYFEDCECPFFVEDGLVKGFKALFQQPSVEVCNLNLNPELNPTWSKIKIKIKSMIKNEAEP